MRIAALRRLAKSARRRPAVILLLCACATAIALGGYFWSARWEYQSFCNRLVLEKQIEARIAQAADDGEDDDEVQAEQPYVHPPFDTDWWRKIIARATVPSRDRPKLRASLTAFVASDASAVTSHDRDNATHWSFRRLDRVSLPEVADDGWVRNPIDRFILARMLEAGVQPNPPADRRTLERRLSFDMTGLPPSFDEGLDYEQLVDHLLAAPGFGERWGRVWLDLARYADSNGYEEDELRPYAFTYRDFVIWAMNEDLPFDHFVRWQIAGDELAADHPLAVAATGFLTAAPYNTFIPQESERRDELDDMVSTMGRAMLGLSVGCARCHDHLYDPIPTSEYYRLVAIFEETHRTHRYLVSDGGRGYLRSAGPVHERRDEVKQMLLASLKEDKIADLDFSDEEKDLLRQPIDPANEKQALLLSWCMRCLMVDENFIDDETEPQPKDRERFEQLQAELAELEPHLPPLPPQGLTLAGSSIAKTAILDGGNLERKGKEVGPGFLAALTTGNPDWSDNSWRAWSPAGDGRSPLPRSALAHWLTDVDHGAGALLARVIVNRLWQHHFGTGLVSTPSDFGSHGERPTHPELLDWLAGELIDHDWRLKHIHRLIVCSATYRQDISHSPEKAQADPENMLIARRRPQRLTAEMLRDAMLAAHGGLNREMYGPATIPPIPREAIFNTQHSPEYTWPAVEAESPAARRRSVYLLLKRTIPIPMLQIFDAPDAGFSCDRRSTTTVPTQALTLWNAPFVRRQAEIMAQRLVDECNVDEDSLADEAQLADQVFVAALRRYPSSQQRQLAIEFLERDRETRKIVDRVADLCHVVFMSNEFIYID